MDYAHDTHIDRASHRRAVDPLPAQADTDEGERETISGGELRQLAAAARDAILIGRNGLGLDLTGAFQGVVGIRIGADVMGEVTEAIEIGHFKDLAERS